MANQSIARPVIVIIGPTASGKTGLVLNLAEDYQGEIIAADSRTVYRQLDIGTAKPTKDEQDRVPHWGLDLIEPDERYSAAQFQDYAYSAIDDIQRRGKIPFLVGGTGLYVNAVIYHYSFVDINQSLKPKLEGLSSEQLQAYCSKNNISLPENHQNKRHLINQILRQGRIGICKSTLPSNIHVVGIATESELLKQRIYDRALTMFESGVIEESLQVALHYGWDAAGLSGNVYQVVKQLAEGDLTHKEAIERFATLDRQLAKRQMTWFKRDPNIKWLQLEEAEHYIAGILTPEQ